MPSSALKIAAIQHHLGGTIDENHARLEPEIRAAAAAGAKVILLPELFQGPYFCKTEVAEPFELAFPAESHPSVLWGQKLARELEVVLPLSIFESSGTQYYNSLVMVDADGTNLGVYRKSHIPDGPGYEEKFYFRPGNTGFKVWETRYAKLGVGICWDQWFPECARILTLMGADVLLYPTAIGSEPNEPDLDTRHMWQGVMIGHSIANVIPVIAVNRIGDEDGQVFYGHSFISNQYGEKIAEFGSKETGYIQHTFDLKAVREARATMGFFRDRRPELYGKLTEL